MSPDAIIGILAVFTIGGFIIIAVIHFTQFLRDPRNMNAAKGALIDDNSSAHTHVRGGSQAEHLK